LRYFRKIESRLSCSHSLSSDPIFNVLTSGSWVRKPFHFSKIAYHSNKVLMSHTIDSDVHPFKISGGSSPLSGVRLSFCKCVPLFHSFLLHGLFHIHVCRGPFAYFRHCFGSILEQWFTEKITPQSLHECFKEHLLIRRIFFHCNLTKSIEEGTKWLSFLLSLVK